MPPHADEERAEATDDEAAPLHREAAARLRDPRPTPTSGPHSPERLRHELNVHEVELKMQVQELRRAHDALERAHDRYASLFDQAPVGYVVVDAWTRVHEANREAARLLGDEAIQPGRPLAARCLGNDADDLHRLITQLEGPSSTTELSFRGATGDRRVVRVVAGRAEEQRVLLALLDVSESRRMERQLAHAQKMEALHALGAGVAHEFNNLLMGILGCADMALSRLPPGSEARPFVDGLRQAARSGSAIAAQLVPLARRSVDDEGPTELSALLTGAATFLRPMLGQHITLSMQVQSTEAWVGVSAGHLEQILLNLALNARKAMPDGGRLTFVVRELVDEGRPQIELSISDTGVGMNQETRRRVFEPYFTTDAEGGTGLGLSTVHAIVTRQGGDVDVTSGPEGTTFVIRLPRVQTDEDAAPVAGGRQPLRVLVVEDDALVRMTARFYLEELGHVVVEADSAEEAQRVLASGAPFDLLLTDVVLPDAPGPVLAAHAESTHPGLALAFMSAHPGATLIAEGRLPPGAHTLQKPFDEAQLAELIERALDGARLP